jgi:cytochrome c-type biogenesis protein CcmH/NrfG
MYNQKAVYSSTTADKFVLRLPGGMREQVAKIAKTNRRSMNSEIISRLEASLDNDDNDSIAAQVSVDSPELTEHERALLKSFRQLAKRQQTALVHLIEHG